PPFSIAGLLERCMGNTSVAAVLLEKFEAQLRSDLGAITSGARAGDADGVARVAHGLKGAAGALTAHDLSGVAAELEQAGRAHRLEAAEDAVSRLQQEIDRCLAYLPVARRDVAGPGAPGAKREG